MNTPKLVPAIVVSCALVSSFSSGSSLCSVEPSQVQDGARPRRDLVYVGTYTSGASEGIYRFELDSDTGRLTSLGVTPGVQNPSFLAFHPKGRFLYAANEIGESGGEKTGTVSAFSIDPESGALKLLNQRPSGGGAPCHLVVDSTGRNVLVANYGGGSVSVLRIGEDGRLGEQAALIRHEGSSVNPRRQKGPHAHSVNLDASNRVAVVADLGIDKLVVYAFDAATGRLEPREDRNVSLSPGAGPRHFAFHPSGKYAYAINELQSTVTALSYDAEKGSFSELGTVSTLPAEFGGENTTAEVQVHPSGRFLYGSNRGHDSIAVFRIDPGRGTLEPVEREPTRGKTPRNFGIDPAGRFLLAANQGSGSVVVFRIDPATGALEPTGHAIDVPTPVCVKIREWAPVSDRRP